MGCPWSRGSHERRNPTFGSDLIDLKNRSVSGQRLCGDYRLRCDGMCLFSRESTAHFLIRRCIVLYSTYRLLDACCLRPVWESDAENHHAPLATVYCLWYTTMLEQGKKQHPDQLLNKRSPNVSKCFIDNCLSLSTFLYDFVLY